jgi:hypothetical protein
LVSECHIAGFAAFGTVVEAVNAEPNARLAFADSAILFAGAIFFAFIALRTNNLLRIRCHSASGKDFT